MRRIKGKWIQYKITNGAVKVDTLFYSLFQKHLKIFFQLIGEPDADVSRYSFVVQEIKQSAFRFDGILQPLTQQDLLYFIEVQFQKRPKFYSRLFAEIHLYLHQYQIKNDWVVVVFFKNRNTEVPPPDHQAVEFERRVVRIYLDEIEDLAQQSVGIGILRLLPIMSKKRIQVETQKLLKQAAQQRNSGLSVQQAIELMQEVLTLKFPNLEPEELAMLLGMEKELEKTRFYQAVTEREAERIFSLIIPKRLKAGCTAEEIAQELEIDVERVQQIIRQSQQTK